MKPIFLWTDIKLPWSRRGIVFLWDLFQSPVNPRYDLFLIGKNEIFKERCKRHRGIGGGYSNDGCIQIIDGLFSDYRCQLCSNPPLLQAS